MNAYEMMANDIEKAIEIADSNIDFIIVNGGTQEVRRAARNVEKAVGDLFLKLEELIREIQILDN